MIADETGALAEEMFEQLQRDGQCARRVLEDDAATAVREALRRRGRSTGVRLRTARMGDVVVAARVDAAIWHDDTATMRAKLTPPT